MALGGGGEQALTDPTKVVARQSRELKPFALREGSLADRQRAQLTVEGLDEARQLARVSVAAAPGLLCYFHLWLPLGR